MKVVGLLRSISIVVLFCSCSQLACSAANIEVLKPVHADDIDAFSCGIRISGEIKLGDLKILKEKSSDDFQATHLRKIICLNSPGGDFVEGLDMAEYIEQNEFETYLERNSVCMSACAWMFMAGQRFQHLAGDSVSRLMNSQATLGFHAPKVDVEAVRKLGVEVAARLYNQAVAEIGKRLLRIANYRPVGAETAQIDATLVAEALVRTGDELLLVDTVGKTIRWGIPVENAEHVVPNSRDDIVMACRNGFATADGRWGDDRLFSEAARDYFAFYDEGTRTLTAMMLFKDYGNGDCEVQIGFAEDMRSIAFIQVV